MTTRHLLERLAPRDPGKRVLEQQGFRLLKLSTAQLESDLSWAAEAGMDGFACIQLPGLFELDTLDVLPSGGFRALVVVGKSVALDGVTRWPELQLLTIANRRDLPDLRGHTDLESLGVTWSSKLALPRLLPRLRSMELLKLNGKIAGLPEAPVLEELSVVGGTLTTLDGVEAYTKLTSLEVSRAPKLHDIASIGYCVELKSAVFDHCPCIGDFGALSSCRRLQRLHVIDCRLMRSVSFVAALPALQACSLVGTSIEDGDTSILQRVPLVEFDDSENYTMRRADFQ